MWATWRLCAEIRTSNRDCREAVRCESHPQSHTFHFCTKAAASSERIGRLEANEEDIRRWEGTHIYLGMGNRSPGYIQHQDR